MRKAVFDPIPTFLHPVLLASSAAQTTGCSSSLLLNMTHSEKFSQRGQTFKASLPRERLAPSHTNVKSCLVHPWATTCQLFTLFSCACVFLYITWGNDHDYNPSIVTKHSQRTDHLHRWSRQYESLVESMPAAVGSLWEGRSGYAHQSTQRPTPAMVLSGRTGWTDLGVVAFSQVSWLTKLL